MMNRHGFDSIDDARTLLRKLGAPERLVRHTELVEEAAGIVLRELTRLGVAVDEHFVRLGVVFHDAGKIEHPSELAQPGHEHEPEGERLLLRAGVDPAVARSCLSHARWPEMTTSFEELLVALADTLWKGKRNADLEKAVVTRAASVAGKSFWDLFVPLDTCFEHVAASGAERLTRS
jgi:hypothetical protein